MRSQRARASSVTLTTWATWRARRDKREKVEGKMENHLTMTLVFASECVAHALIVFQACFTDQSPKASPAVGMGMLTATGKRIDLSCVQARSWYWYEFSS